MFLLLRFASKSSPFTETTSQVDVFNKCFFTKFHGMTAGVLLERRVGKTLV